MYVTLKRVLEMFKKIYAILYVMLLLSSCSVCAEDCKIDRWEESAFKPVPSKLKIFLEQETKGLFFNESSRHIDFVKTFYLSKHVEGDKYNFWDNDRTTFAKGSWNGAQVHNDSGGNTIGHTEFSGLSGPIYLGNGLGKVSSISNTKFSYELEIFQNLDKKYFSKDVFRAIKEKLGLPDLKLCTYDDDYKTGSVGYGPCWRVNDMDDLKDTLFKYGDLYFKLNITVLCMDDCPIGSLDHTVVVYKVEQLNGLNSHVDEYKKCMSLKEAGSRLKL